MKPLKQLTLKTQRIYLRPINKSDLEDFYDISSIPELSASIAWPKVQNIQDAKNLLDDFLHNITFVIEINTTHKVIGILQVDDIVPVLKHHPALLNKKGCTLSFALHPHFQRQGIITETLQSFIDILFHQYAFNYVNCGYFDFNEASKKVQEKLGFQFLLVHQVQLNHVTVDVLENICWNPKYKNDPLK